MTMNQSIPAEHFERLYAEKNGDPWDLATSDYERRKYEATIAALGGRHFANAVEIGCSIGTLTERLAPSCDALLGIDYVETPLQQARQRCAELPQVRFQRMAIPAEWPDGRFDLIMLSEVLYFISLADLHALAARCEESAAPDGILLLVNWLGPNDGVLSGDAAALTFLQSLGEGWACENVAVMPRYRIDIARRHRRRPL